MSEALRIFAWEYVTAGGLGTSAAAAPLIAEGLMMVRALAHDLAQIDGVRPIVARGPAIAMADVPAAIHPVGQNDPWRDWTAAIADADAVWPIAPETDGLLAAVTRAIGERGKPVLNSREDAVAITASKRATALHLAVHGIVTVPTLPIDADPPPSAAGWVVKPDDGAGAVETYHLAERPTVERWREANAGRGFVLQPYLPGPALSLSLMAQEGTAWLLACNLQHIERAGTTFAYRGSRVSGAEHRRAALAPIAAAIARALPGLWGYVGVDLIDTTAGPVVLEINPRLTTSYVGLGRSLALNPAALVLALRDRPLAELVRPLAPRPVEVRVPNP